jgi:hypothetical protein
MDNEATAASSSELAGRLESDQGLLDMANKMFSESGGDTGAPSKPPTEQYWIDNDDDPPADPASPPADPTPTPPAAPTAPPAEPPADEPPADGPKYADLAAQYGADPSWLDSYATREDAEAALAEWDRQLIASGQQRPQQPEGMQSPYYQQPPQQFTPPGQPQQPQLPPEVQKILSELPDDEPVRGAVDFMLNKISQNDQLMQSLIMQQQQVAQQAAQRQQMQTIQSMNSAFDKMDSNLFGKTESLNPLQQSTRVHAARQIESIEYQYLLNGMTPPPVEVLVERASRALYLPQLLRERELKNAKAAQQQALRKTGAPASPPTEVGSFGKQAAQHADVPLEENPVLHQLYAHLEAQG